MDTRGLTEDDLDHLILMYLARKMGRFESTVRRLNMEHVGWDDWVEDKCPLISSWPASTSVGARHYLYKYHFKLVFKFDEMAMKF